MNLRLQISMLILLNKMIDNFGLTVGTRLPGEEGLEAEERGSHPAAGLHQRTAGQKKSSEDEE